MAPLMKPPDRAARPAGATPAETAKQKVREDDHSATPAKFLQEADDGVLLAARLLGRRFHLRPNIARVYAAEIYSGAPS